MDANEQKVLPLKIIDGEDKYVRLQYNFCPNSVANSTVSRSLVRDEQRPTIGYIDHTLQSGESVRFQGLWKKEDESMKECIILFADDEVDLIPLSASLLKVKKME